jgi:hypothetical protein
MMSLQFNGSIPSCRILIYPLVLFADDLHTLATAAGCSLWCFHLDRGSLEGSICFVALATAATSRSANIGSPNFLSFFCRCFLRSTVLSFMMEQSIIDDDVSQSRTADVDHNNENGEKNMLEVVDNPLHQHHHYYEVDPKNGVTQSLAPSHILEDGRFIYLPPPNAVERSRFFERTIARHGIFEADMNQEQHVKRHLDLEHQEQEGMQEMVGQQQPEENNDTTASKIHPLAVASARLQANGLNELNRAINLATLVQTGAYFSYTNIVDPSLEADAAAAASAAANAAAAAAKSTSANGRPTGTTSNNNNNSNNANTNNVPGSEMTTQKTEAWYCLKRKITQFEKASRVLKRHEKRLRAGVQAQRVIDRRLFQLRQQWRLVAPEHGTRARLHAARTNEVIAVDVDVYDRNRVVQGGNGTNISSGGDPKLLYMGNDSRRAISLAGRLASRVPRFATIELRDNFQVTSAKEKTLIKINGDFIKGGKNMTTMTSVKEDADTSQDDIEMQDDKDGNQEIKINKDKKINFGLSHEDLTRWTRAEPFAVADPSLGRVMENFDPSKIPMLNLQLDIQKRSTGFLQSARLAPMSTVSTDGNEQICNAGDEDDDNNKKSSDEDLLVSLQHSLFCANLFESIRNELDPDIVDGVRGTKISTSSFSPVRPKTLQGMAWLSSESEENFVAPPTFLVGGDAARGLAELSLIHCHEGEVKVQLDWEYQLSLKLVEANADESMSPFFSQNGIFCGNNKSGSQSPAQLHALCRALLLHAQDVYHRHSLYLGEREKRKRAEESAKGDAPRGLARVKREDLPEKARILQSCVSLGSKMLFEKRIRRALSRLSTWVKTSYGESMHVEWLALSIFDLYSKFTISCRQYVVDGVILRDTLTVTRITETEAYRKVHFHSEKEFEIYLRLELQRQMKS